MTEKLKQLKKLNFLAVLLPSVLYTVEEIKKTLHESFTFVDSYVDYLVDYYIENGKITRDENGMIMLTATKAKANPRIMYLVATTGGAHHMLKLEVSDKTKPVTELMEDGWRFTPGAAIKVMTSAVFAAYKSHMAQLNAMKEALPAMADELEVLDHPIALAQPEPTGTDIDGADEPEVAEG